MFHRKNEQENKEKMLTVQYEKKLERRKMIGNVKDLQDVHQNKLKLELTTIQRNATLAQGGILKSKSNYSKSIRQGSSSNSRSRRSSVQQSVMTGSNFAINPNKHTYKNTTSNTGLYDEVENQKLIDEAAKTMKVDV